MKLIDPLKHKSNRLDRISYEMMMNVSDSIRSIFEYD